MMIKNRNLAIQIDPRLGFELLATDRENLVLAQGRLGLFEDLSGSGLPLPASESLDIEAQRTQASTGAVQRYIASQICAEISCSLVIDIPQQWPDSLILQAHLENRGEHPLSIGHQHVFELDLNPAWANHVWSLQGAAVQWGQDFAFPLPDSFSRQNDLGQRDGGEGGGIPLNYIWNREFGLALAHIEKEQIPWRMPVLSEPDQGIKLRCEPPTSVELLPGQIFSTPRLLISLHSGDFFAPLARYREILAAQGLKAPQPHPEDYQPAWCSWGYEFDVCPDEVTGVLPVLKELELHWLTLDDRWFDHYGDWNPRPDTFPGGPTDMRRMVVDIHQAGSYAQIWWYPLCAEDGQGRYDQPYSVSQVLREHPEWVIRHADGRVARNNRGLAILCPALPEVQEYTLEITRRFIEDWGFDGHKLDNIYTVAPCYNPAHHHIHPEEALEGFARIYAQILAETRQRKPYAVTQICPCGTPLTHTLIPAASQVVTADPTSSTQIRQRIKFYKALMGADFPVFADHVELSDAGADFASEIGPGGIIGTKFVWPPDENVRARLEEYWPLTPKKKETWKHWLTLARQLALQSGEYLNLYDLAFDKPETHAIRKGDRLYYAFYSEQLHETYQGSVELRGLEVGRYRVRDVIHACDLGWVSGPIDRLNVSFQGALLLEARLDEQS